MFFCAGLGIYILSVCVSENYVTPGTRPKAKGKAKAKARAVQPQVQLTPLEIATQTRT